MHATLSPTDVMAEKRYAPADKVYAIPYATRISTAWYQYPASCIESVKGYINQLHVTISAIRVCGSCTSCILRRIDRVRLAFQFRYVSLRSYRVEGVCLTPTL
jgi:hypothetical protein